MAIQNGNVEWARELRGRNYSSPRRKRTVTKAQGIKVKSTSVPAKSEAVSLAALTKVAPREPLLVLVMEMGFFVGWLKSVNGDANHGHVCYPNRREYPPLP